MKPPAISLRTLLGCAAVFLVAGGMTGCAGGSEFQTIPQKGANRTGIYPRFSVRPQAQTQQLTPAESARLSNELANKAKDLRSRMNNQPQKAQSFSTRKENAQREAEEVLRQIEQGK